MTNSYLYKGIRCEYKYVFGDASKVAKVALGPLTGQQVVFNMEEFFFSKYQLLIRLMPF